jgi:hypothetical protein
MLDKICLWWRMFQYKFYSFMKSQLLPCNPNAVYSQMFYSYFRHFESYYLKLIKCWTSEIYSNLIALKVTWNGF